MTLDRRQFLATTAGALAAIAAGCRDDGARSRAELPVESSRPEPTGPLPTRPLGKSGLSVTALALGGQGVIERRGHEDAAVALIRRALALGVNYFDTAIKYGPSRATLGRALDGARDGVVLASKVHARDRDGAWRQFEESLKLLRTERVDLLQIHDVKPADLEPIFAKDGVYRALVEMREQGLVRFVGVTGHTEPGVLLEAIRREPFDNVLMALNCADPHYLPFAAQLLPECVRQGIGIVAMKVIARGALFREGGLLNEPGVTTLDQAIHYVLTYPVSCVLIGCDSIEQLEANAASVRRFAPLTDAQMRRLEALTRPYAQHASYFKDWYRLSRLERLPYMPLVGRKPRPSI